LIQRSVDLGTVMDLDISIRVDSENPRAVKSWKHIAVSGTKLGISIGGIFTDVDFIDDDDWFSGLVVHDIELVEASLVGVPANPRAYTEFVSEMTRGFKRSVNTAVELIDAKNPGAFETRRHKSTVTQIRKSLLGGVRPEDMHMAKLSVPLDAYDRHDDGIETRAAGNREDAAADPLQQTVVENPNATPTKDRPVMPEVSANPQRHPNVGPPNSDEPLAVPMHGTPSVVGNNQPPESNVVSIDNSAPAPARHHGSEDDGLQGTVEQLPSRPEQHAEMGRADAPSGADGSVDGTNAEIGAVSASKPDAKAPSAPATATAPDAKPKDPAQPSNAAKPTTDRAPDPAPKKDPTQQQAPKSTDDFSILGIIQEAAQKQLSVNDIAQIVKDAVSGDDADEAAMTPQERVSSKAVKSMRAITRSAKHGVCSESHAQLKRAHNQCKSLLPDDYTIPEDAIFPAYGASALAVSFDDVEHKMSVVSSKLTQLDDAITNKTAEIKRLDEELAVRRATPLGRKSVATPSGSNGTGSKPTLSLASYNKSTSELNRDLNERVETGGLALSARDESA
jgi:hypothetical protein